MEGKVQVPPTPACDLQGSQLQSLELLKKYESPPTSFPEPTLLSRSLFFRHPSCRPRPIPRENGGERRETLEKGDSCSMVIYSPDQVKHIGWEKSYKGLLQLWTVKPEIELAPPLK